MILLKYYCVNNIGILKNIPKNNSTPIAIILNFQSPSQGPFTTLIARRVNHPTCNKMGAFSMSAHFLLTKRRGTGEMIT